jgi:imidazolonepropionase-like amidohydrolase
VLDGTGRDPVGPRDVEIVDGRIAAIERTRRTRRRLDIDAEGHLLMPGLTDAHVHICAVTENITDQHRFYPPSYIAARAMKRAEECLMQGFTTARDAGGADYGFRMLLDEGHFVGPRLLVSGRR